MKSLTLGLCLAMTPLAGPVVADARTDAQYIVDQTVNRAIFEGALSAMRPALISAIENDLR